jgi:hypothetical protein
MSIHCQVKVGEADFEKTIFLSTSWHLHCSPRMVALVTQSLVSLHDTSTIMLFHQPTLRSQLLMPLILLCLFWTTIGVPLVQPLHILDPDTVLSELAPLTPLHNASRNETGALLRRECEYDAATDDYICDDILPTMAQLVDRLRNKPGGLATPDRHAVFYTNLEDPNQARAGAWLVTWLHAKGYRDKYYWWPKMVNKECKLE